MRESKAAQRDETDTQKTAKFELLGLQDTRPTAGTVIDVGFRSASIPLRLLDFLS